MPIPMRRPMRRYLIGLLLVLPWGPSASGEQYPSSPVIVASVPHLIRKPAHLFNLGGKTLRFLPQKGGYRVQTLSTADLAPTPRALGGPELLARQGKRKLPFAFPFGGKAWKELFVNLTGSLAFGQAESAWTGARSAWAAGGMLSVAAVLDERSASGQEALIAVLWAANDAHKGMWKVSTGGDNRRFVVTWEVQRVPWGHAVEGHNRFQVRLYPDGVIEMAYVAIARPDGIVGLFPGVGTPATLLDHVACPADAAAPEAQVAAVAVFDAGTTLKFVFTLRDAIPLRLQHGSESFHILIDDGVTRSQGWLTIADKITCYADVDADPRTLGYRIHGKTLALFVSKTRLIHPTHCRWAASVECEQDGKTEVTAIVPDKNPRPIERTQARASERPLTHAQEPSVGNLFEVFHYPWAPKDSLLLLKSLYARLPADDDLAVVFTDFRIDDLFAQGPSSGALNVAIQGIGERAASPQSTRERGFARLQAAPATVWIGSPFFSEHGPDELGMTYDHFARGVAWLAHELSHRWGPELRFRNPQTGKEEPLTTSDPHWLADLYAPALTADTTSFPASSAPSCSVMVDRFATEWRTNPDGTFQFRRTPWWRNPGYSALDLYVMGLIPPEQVPDTFLMQNIRPATAGKPAEDGWSPPVTATKVAVRIQDILAVMGPRIPDAAQAQKTFRLGVYLVSAPGRKVAPAMLDRANQIALALADFFETATGHRMHILFTR